MDMAMPDRSVRANPMDPRIPCPVCGQPVHPVAGRCKYCKTDLVKLRESRGMRAPRIDPAMVDAAANAPAAVPMPFAPPAAAAPAAAPVNGHNGHTMEPAYAPLDPLPVKTSWTRRWPLLVAIVAGIAILVCAYLLLFDQDGGKHAAAATHKDTTPSHDPMNTQPDPPPLAQGGQLGQPGTQHGQPQLPPNFDDPPPGSVPPPDPDPNPPVLTAPPQQGGGSLGGAALPPAEEFFPELADKLDSKLKACGLDFGKLGMPNIDLGSMLGGFGGDPDTMREEVRQGRCTYDEAKATRCFANIDAIQCKGGDISQLGGMMMQLDDCMSALQCQ
jgi:hypothetical protein